MTVIVEDTVESVVLTRPDNVEWLSWSCQMFIPALNSEQCPLKALAQWRAFLGRKNTPGPTPSGYGTVPSAVMETFMGTTSEAE